VGKKFVGHLFDVIIDPDDLFGLIPMKAVQQATPSRPKGVTAADGWLPPGGYAHWTQWALDNRAALDTYALRVADDGTAAEQLQRYLAEKSDGKPETLSGLPR
jgi:hypothetical protein